ncbi:MAG: hypothetical protein CBB87_04230 [Micavibrio sp. TMED27]|nr:hypothetical protein [Micavibrio sp.]OUT91243.1 MAG: hypothetical protein CBB87_04230 [Micavibrio sp. TMED27]
MLLKKKSLKAKSETRNVPQPSSKDIHSSLPAKDLSLFWDMSHEVMVVVNDMGHIIDCNAAFLDSTGYERTDLESLHFMDLFEEGDRPYIRNTIQSFGLDEEGAGSSVLDFEAGISRKGGGVRYLEWRQQLHEGLLYCTGRDVSAIKVQESVLSRKEKQLYEAESIGRMGHWHWGFGEESMEWSDEIYRIFGVQAGSFDPTFDALNALVHREDVPRVNQAFQRALIEENDYDMEFRVKVPGSHDVRFIRCEGRCWRDESGEVTALYGIMQDMTERMLYERELKNAKESAERAYAAKTQFLANMSHELRTPLNAIIGFSEMMEQQLLGPIGTEKYLDYISGIRESGTHLLDLISDILDMSKIEAGKYELDLEDLNISKSVQLALHMMEGRAHEAGVKLSLDNQLAESLKIRADRRAVLQILLNILSNAVKFTEEGGEVRIHCKDRSDYIVITISDTGIGIPANKLPQVTRPFEQVSASYSRDHEGSGLGLAITKELVQMHDGNLSIESTVGVGTTVSVRLSKVL